MLFSLVDKPIDGWGWINLKMNRWIYVFWIIGWIVRSNEDGYLARWINLRMNR